jgi:Asp-tRNA(Asn)/Glu-tRNA(Gln) amidotransferase A subunit family amidase
MPLAELAAAVREGRTTSSALVAESLHRIEAGDGPVNAVVLRRDEDALADAAAARRSCHRGHRSRSRWPACRCW